MLIGVRIGFRLGECSGRESSYIESEIVITLIKYNDYSLFPPLLASTHKLTTFFMIA